MRLWENTLDTSEHRCIVIVFGTVKVVSLLGAIVMTAPFTVTRDVTRFETVILSVAGPTVTVTQYSRIIPAPLTVTTVRESAVDASLIVYFGIGMIVVIAVAAAVVAQRIKQ
ncbi:MAG: hypothetical protein QXG21_07320 [Candidatus Caldarchaeum sp.]